MRECGECGTAFESPRSADKYCGVVCRRAVKARRAQAWRDARTEGRQAECLQCGATFEPTHGNHRLCSDECSEARRHETAIEGAERRKREDPEKVARQRSEASRRWRERNPPPPEYEDCGWCGQTFEKPHGNAGFCSEQCRSDHKQDYNFQYVRDNQDTLREYHRQYREDNAQLIAEKKRAYYEANVERIKAQAKERRANWGEEEIERDRLAYRAKRAANPELYRRISRENRRKRRARLAEAVHDDFTEREIFDRDGWVCQLCNEAVDPNLPASDMHGPSLDHVVPVSHGGDHTRANVQLAHAVCNYRKGNRATSTGEQLRIIG